MYPDISIVCPVFNEEGNIHTLCDKINQYLRIDDLNFDLIFIDDCSLDSTIDKIIKCKNKYPFEINYFVNEKNKGISSCIDKGVKLSENKIIITIDGDLQNDPRDIITLLEYHKKVKSDNFGIIIGQRLKRVDNYSKIITSKIGFIIRRLIFKDRLKDVACGLRLIDKKSYLELPYFDNMHRYYSVLFKRHAFDVYGIEISHYKRMKGKSKFGLINRLFPGIFDIFGVIWLIKRKK